MLTKRWTAPGTSRARRGLAAGLGLLCGATMITGAATSGAQAAGDPSGAAGTAGTWCPSPAPSYDQVGDLLAELEAESLRVSAKRGLRSQISFRQRSASGTTRSEHWHFVGDPSTGRSRWFSSSTSTDAFGFSAQEAFTEQLSA